MGAEYELKYRGTPEAQAAILADFPGLWETLVMETTYYDTPSGALSGKRYTLRRRLENGSSVCTLKTPGEGMLRGEWQVACNDIQRAIPELCKLDCPDGLPALFEDLPVKETVSSGAEPVAELPAKLWNNAVSQMIL